MDPISLTPLGRTGLTVSRLGLGTAPIGNYNGVMANSEAAAIIDVAWEAGVRVFDTAPMYGYGLSEHRCGHSLFERPRNAYVLCTKVGYMLEPQDPAGRGGLPYVDAGPFRLRYDYSYDATMRSIEGSLNRLLTHRIDVALVHDADVFNHGVDGQKGAFDAAMQGAVKALLKLRSEGVIRAVGFGVNEWEVCHRALLEADLDCFLLAGRYTLLEQEALHEFLPLCERRNVSVILGGGFNSGVLAKGAIAGARYNYAAAPEEILKRVRNIEAVCSAFDVPLAAAALQFVLAHPAISTVIPGTRSVGQFQQNLSFLRQPIPADFWQKLKSDGLVLEAAPVPT